MATMCDDGQSLAREADDEAAFRQLRHLTRNALQRVIGSVHRPELTATPEGRRLADDVERAICLTAAISDALFGLTRAPGPLPERLRSLAVSLVSLYAAPDQEIELDVRAFDLCPEEYADAVLRAANEFIGNALKHGLAGRTQGRIEVRLSCDTWGSTRLLVADDGMGVGGDMGDGEGLHLARSLAAAHGGSVALRFGARTEAELILPHPAARLAAAPPARRRRFELTLIALSVAALVGVLTAAERFLPLLHRGPAFCIGSMLLAGPACP